MSRWGEPTQTFVRREAVAVAARGIKVNKAALKRPVGDATDVLYLRPPSVVLAAATALVRHPVRTSRVFACVLRRARLRNLGHHLAAAAIGVAWATRGISGGHLHAHFGWVAATATWACATLTGLPFSVVLHAFELHDRRRVDGFTAVPLSAASAVFTISVRDQELVRARYGIAAEVLRMGIPNDWVIDAPRTASHHRMLIASVGSLVEKKGHDVLLRAVARADSRWTLEIAGVGPCRDRLERLASELEIADRVTFSGLLTEEEVASLLRRAGLFCLAAREAETGDRDGIPVALMEAMAQGVPVVTTRAGAIEELVDGAGLLVPPNDIDALAFAIDSLMDGETAADLSRAGLERIRAGWTLDVSTRRIAKLLLP